MSLGRLGLIALAGLAACHRPRPLDLPGMPRPTLEPDPPPGSAGQPGLATLRAIVRDRDIELELGRERQALLAFDCAEPPAARRTGRFDLRGHRQCYRCVMPVVEDGPQDPYGPSPLDSVLGTIATTLRGYPASFVRAAQLERLALCDRLVDEAHDDPAIAGLADYRHRRMLVQVNSSLGAAEIVHHEIFHLFDAATVGSPDLDWEQLNPPSFRYGERIGRPGFVDDYGETSIAEDKATVFGAIMSDGEAFCRRAVADPIIRAKGELIRDRLTRALPVADAALLYRGAPCLGR